MSHSHGMQGPSSSYTDLCLAVRPSVSGARCRGGTECRQMNEVGAAGRLWAVYSCGHVWSIATAVGRTCGNTPAGGAAGVDVLPVPGWVRWMERGEIYLPPTGCVLHARRDQKISARPGSRWSLEAWDRGRIGASLCGRSPFYVAEVLRAVAGGELAIEVVGAMLGHARTWAVSGEATWIGATPGCKSCSK